jgi:hypothetical protein
MRGFIKNNKIFLILTCAVLLLYILFSEKNAQAEENITDNMPTPAHVFGDVHNEERMHPILVDLNWVRVLLHAEISVSGLRNAGDYTEESWRIFEGTLMNAVAVLNRPWSIEPEMEAWKNHLRNARNNLERLPKADEETFKHWTLALQGLQAGIAAAIIFAIVWVKQ